MATRLAAQRNNFVSSQSGGASSVTMASTSPPPHSSSISPPSASGTVVVVTSPPPAACSSPIAHTTTTTTTTRLLTAEDLANAVVINGSTANVNGNLLILEESHSPSDLAAKEDGIPISLQHIIPQVDKLFFFNLLIDGN